VIVFLKVCTCLLLL
ncbi:putative uracil-DNA glycosylase, partial [Chlamydia psittaci 84-8471/1]